MVRLVHDSGYLKLASIAKSQIFKYCSFRLYQTVFISNEQTVSLHELVMRQRTIKNGKSS